MKALTTAFLFAAASLVAAEETKPANNNRPGPPAVITVETRDMKVDFSGDRAWTLSLIAYKGETEAGKPGFYGTVFAPEGGKWIGTGHNEGGLEQVQDVTLTIDGQPCALTDKASYHGHRAELHKHSLLGPLKLEATYVITDDGILERHRYEATADVQIATLYAFMHPWIPRTTEWLAELGDGSLIDGKFDSSGDFKLKQDPKWTAIYDPVSHRAMLAWYPVPLVGQGIKSGYWDKTVYHKLYNQIYAHAAVASGAKFEAAVIIRGVEADEASWKEAAKKCAAEVKAAFERGEIGF